MNVEPNIRRLVCKIVLDVACLLLVGIPILVYYSAGKPYKRGFFCDDESLRHPFHESTVPSWMLYVVGIGLPVVVILGVEYIIYIKESDTRQKIRFMSMRLPHWVWESYKYIGVFSFGAACSQLTTDIAKYTIGRLRPHFFDICKPDIDCTDPKYKNKYIENYTCQQKNERLLKEVRLSFPSGHSSFSLYCMLYLAMYLHARMTWKGSKLLKHVLQYVCIMMAFYTALTRISDYKHHWSDVLAGSFQGGVVAILIVVFVSDLFEEPKKEVIHDSPASDGIRMSSDLAIR